MFQLIRNDFWINGLLRGGCCKQAEVPRNDSDTLEPSVGSEMTESPDVIRQNSVAYPPGWVGFREDAVECDSADEHSLKLPYFTDEDYRQFSCTVELDDAAGALTSMTRCLPFPSPIHCDMTIPL